MNKSLIYYFNNSFFPLYYFTYLEQEGLFYKFGVIDEQRFKDDLEHWSILSVAGRLHKPVRLIHNRNEELDMLMTYNRETAV